MWGAALLFQQKMHPKIVTGQNVGNYTDRFMLLGDSLRIWKFLSWNYWQGLFACIFSWPENLQKDIE